MLYASYSSWKDTEIKEAQFLPEGSICKMGIIIPPHGAIVRIKYKKACKGLKTVLGSY